MAQPEKYTSSVADLEGRKLLFIAYFFPPTISTGVPGCMRTIKFLRHMQGGECHVLTTPAAELSEADSALRHIPLPVNGETLHRVASRDLFHVLLAGRSRLKQLIGKNQNAPAPPQKSTFRSTAEPENTSRNQLQKLKDFVYNLCYFPDQAGPWILPAVMRGRRVVRENNIDVIFATGSPWSDLIVGYLISRLTGKPLIVDFRDPWMNNPFHHSKGAVLDNWAHRWEKRIVEKADVVSLNTDPLRAEFLERYPEQPADKFFVMPNGYDLTDFGALEPSGEHHAEDDWFTLCHAGFLYGVRDPAALLDAITVANEKLAGSQKQIRFRQIGDVQLDYDLAARYQALIANGTLLLEPPRPYKQCLQALARADMVVNIQPATRSQVPSKLYDYLAINRPILNITPKDGALGRMVSEHGLGELFDFDETDALSERLLALVESSQSQPPFAGYRNRSLFDTRNTAADLAEKVKKLTAE